MYWRPVSFRKHHQCLHSYYSHFKGRICILFCICVFVLCFSSQDLYFNKDSCFYLAKDTGIFRIQNLQTFLTLLAKQKGVHLPVAQSCRKARKLSYDNNLSARLGRLYFIHNSSSRIFYPWLWLRRIDAVSYLGLPITYSFGSHPFYGSAYWSCARDSDKWLNPFTLPFAHLSIKITLYIQKCK